MSESIYPSLKTNQEVNDVINQHVNKQRAQKIVDKIKELERQLEHYQKVSNRWKQSGKVIRITNLALTGIVSGAVATLAVLSTVGIAIPIVATAVLGGYAVIQSSTLEGMNVGMIKRKSHKYKEKCNIIQSHIYKMNFYYEKARQDGVITVDELEGFNKLATDFDNAIAAAQSTSMEHGDAIDMATLKHDAEIEAKIEAQTEIKNKLKNEAKQKLLSSVAS
jgi:hypothetical protein